jgi:hypothetical protein
LNKITYKLKWGFDGNPGNKETAKRPTCTRIKLKTENMASILRFQGDGLWLFNKYDRNILTFMNS